MEQWRRDISSPSLPLCQQDDTYQPRRNARTLHKGKEVIVCNIEKNTRANDTSELDLVDLQEEIV